MMNCKDELYHYGVPGMRWGVRKSKNIKPSSDSKEAAKLKKKHVSEMSNDELKTLNKRQELEKKHKELNPSKIAKGIAIAAAVALAIGTINNLYNNSKNAINNGKEVTKKYKAHQLSIKRQKQTQQIGKGIVNQHSNSKISGIGGKKYKTRIPGTLYTAVGAKKR